MRLSRLRMERRRNSKAEVGDSGAKALQNNQLIRRLLDEADLRFIAAEGGDSDELRRERHAVLRDFINGLEQQAVEHTRQATQAGLIMPSKARALQKEIRCVCRDLRALATGEIGSHRPEQLAVLLGAMDLFMLPKLNVIAIS